MPATKKKPAKPYPDFPLFPHATRRWAKKIKGKMHYFGPWDNPDKALKLYLDQRDDLHAGRRVRSKSGGLSVGELVNRYLSAKRPLVDSGEMSAAHWAHMRGIGAMIVKEFDRHRPVADLAADDFAEVRASLAEGRGLVTLGNYIERIRIIFNWAYEAGLLASPIRFGPDFRPPSNAILRREKQKKGLKLFEAAELRKLIRAAPQPLKAMILLGANAGLGNADVGRLRERHLDLQTGWLDFPRPKTAVGRRAWLWPETVAAIKEAIADRPEPKTKAEAGLVFLRADGRSWYVELKLPAPNAGTNGDGQHAEKAKMPNTSNPVADTTRRLLLDLGLHRPGLGFYTLRHVFLTIGEESRDHIAVAHVMGHVVPGMGTAYREKVSDERLRDVCEHVRTWLFGKTKKTKPSEQRHGNRMARR
jgi:integrase